MPAVSGTPTQVKTSATTAADLAGTPDDQFKEGDFACVESLWPNSTFRLRRTALGGVPDNVSTIATFTGNGYWEVIAAGGNVLVFATVADLAAYNDIALLDGALVYVQSVRSYWSKLVGANPGVVDNITNVRNPSNTATWLRDEMPSPSWGTQPAWYVDSVTGNDEYVGDTTLTALATWDEFVRRVATLVVSMTVNIVSAPAQRIVGRFSASTTGLSLTVQGVPTVLVTSAANYVNPTGNARGTVTSAGIDFSLYVGRIARAVGTDNLLPITSNAGAVGRGGFWCSGFANTKPVDGTDVEVLNLPTVDIVRIFTDGVPVQVKYLEMTSTSSTDGTSIIDAGVSAYAPTYFHWFGCHFNNNVQLSMPSTWYMGCLFDRVASGTTFTGVGHVASFFGGGSIGGLACTSFAMLDFTGFLVEGGGVGTVFTGRGVTVSDSATYPLGVFATTASAITLQQGATFRSGGQGAGATYGSTSGATGIAITTGARFSCTGTPTITGITDDFTTDGLTALVPPPSAGGVWSAATDLSGPAGAGWGKWVAAGRKFVNYATLSAVAN